MKTCPRCAEQVQPAAIVCRYCGHEFGSAPAMAAVSSERRLGLYFVGALVLALAVAAAWTSGDNAPAPPQISPNPLHDQIAAMGVLARRETFARLLRASGERCPFVRRAFYQGMERSSRTAFWDVDCGGERQWIVSIETDGKGKLLECGVSKALGGGCWRTFDAMNAEAKAKRAS